MVTNPDYCSPEDLRQSDYFVEVKNHIREAVPQEISFANTDDPIFVNQQLTYNWLNKTRDLAKNKENIEIQTLNDVDKFIFQYPKYDSEVSKYLYNSGYLEHFDSDVRNNPYRYDYDLFRSLINEQSIPSEIIKQELRKEPDMLYRFATNYSGYLDYYTQMKLEYFKAHSTLYKNLLSLSITRLSILHRLATEENLDVETIKTIEHFLKVKDYI